MKASELQFQGVSENLKYIFTNRGMIPTADFFRNGKSVKLVEYSYNNLDVAVDIVKEHKELYYKLNKISLVEYSNASRKFFYQIIEIFQPKNQIEIIKEWEQHFGNKLLLINESVDTLLVEQRVNNAWDSIKELLYEAWYNPLSWDWKGGAERVGKWAGDTVKGAVDWTKEQGRQIKQKGVMGWAADKASSVWNSVKSAVSKAYKCLTNNFVECLMEGLRAASFSALGMGAMTALTFVPGVGQIADFIVFGSLLIWDIYKALSGKYESGEYQWSFMDIIIDAVCIIIPALGGGLKAAGAGIKTAEQLGAAAAKEGSTGILSKALGVLKGGLSKVLSTIGSASKWLGEKLGLKFLENFGTKAQSFVTNSIEKATAAAESKGLKVGTGTPKAAIPKKIPKLTLTKPLPVVAKKTGQTILITAALCAALGVDAWTCRHKVENGEITPEQVQKAQESLTSKEGMDKLNKISDEEIKDMQLF